MTRTAEFAGRVAVVTGGGTGIGAATARALAARGATVVLAARRADRIRSVADGLTRDGHAAHAVSCDVTDEASVTALARAAEAVGPVSLLVNNAGAAASTSVVKTSLDEWNRLLAVNATGAFLVTRAFLSGMLERKWGRVVNVASVAALHGARYISAYAAAKHALLGFTRSAAEEVQETGVTVNAVCPAFVDTGMTDETLARIQQKTGRSKEEALQAVLETARQPRLVTAEEVADTVVGLMLREGANGEAPVLDGREAGTTRYSIINPEAMGAPRGWNNGMLAPPGGRVLFIAGQTARDASGRVPPSDFVTQFDRALANVLLVLAQAGGAPEAIGRLTIYVTDVARYRESLKPLGDIYRRQMGRHFPAMALVEVKGLVDENAVVEIEATAVV